MFIKVDLHTRVYKGGLTHACTSLGREQKAGKKAHQATSTVTWGWGGEDNRTVSSPCCSLLWPPEPEKDSVPLKDTLPKPCPTASTSCQPIPCTQRRGLRTRAQQDWRAALPTGCCHTPSRNQHTAHQILTFRRKWVLGGRKSSQELADFLCLDFSPWTNMLPAQRFRQNHRPRCVAHSST